MNTSSIQTAEIVFLAFLTIAAIDFGFCYGNTNTGCIEGEKRALLSFKQGLNDTSNRLSSWGVEDDCCNWAGVVCDNVTGHVLALHLQNPSFDSDYSSFDSDYSLGGEINSSLVNLKQLNHLDLSGNDFGGIPVPSFIGSLANLQYLNLSNAGFGGTVPHQLGKLSSMRFLSLGSTIGSRLDVGNLQWVLGLSHLEVLDLSGGNFTTAPDWLQVINKLPSLVELDLSGCNLDHIPQQVSVNFTSLAVLDLSHNFFDSMIPSWIFSLSGLVSLELSSSSFQCPFPSVVPNMTSLRYLDLSWNDLNCAIPSWIFSLSGLVSLDLSWSAFQCPFPLVVPNMTSLRYLDLSRNDDLNCAIPSWMYSFNRLEFLDLTSNGLEGGISDEIGNLTSAISLLLSYNNLDGKLPSSIGNLASVKTIDLSNNKLIGTLPRSLGNLCNLRFLFMSDNKFSGKLFTVSSKCEEYALESMSLYNNQLSGLPNQLGQFGNIRELDLRNNSLSGPIPDTLGSLASITSISLAKNQLNGTLPESLGQLSKLQNLDLSDNLLEGIVSEVQFTNLRNLDSLYAAQNQLTLKVSPDWNPPFQLGNLDLANWHLGPKFPMWLQSQKALQFLDLSCTGISDQIPTWFWNTSSSASYRNLSNNQIHGELPYLDALETMSRMYLNSNKFSGPLPVLSSNLSELDLSENLFFGSLSHFLCDWKEAPSLIALTLGDNLLSGEIPDCWTGWESLNVVELGNNNLTGTIPSSMGLLSSLISLHLRNNHLSGEIPSALQNCYNLKVVDLSENEFNGSIHKWVGERLSSLRILSLRGNKLEGVIPRELCRLSSLQVLDLANNNLSGALPRCINNLTSMAVKLNKSDPINYKDGFRARPVGGFLERAILVMKGGSYQYDKILALVALMDLSNNNISGNIPEEITSLLGLISLNLSGNHLSGVIPNKIGNMGWLGSLDLSRNQLYGDIPPTMSSMTFLSYLNLSYNNLSGAIPLSTQLQSFDASSFIGNNLCGLPLSDNCSIGEETPSQGNKGESAGGDAEVDWFYLCMALGFGTGFWSVSIVIFSIKSWRDAYFLFLENVWTRLVLLYVRRRV